MARLVRTASVVRCRWSIVVDIDRAEPVDGLLQAVAQFDRRLPLDNLLGERNIGATACGIINRKWFKDDLRAAARERDNHLCELSDRELRGVAQIHRAVRFRLMHHANQAFDQIVAITEGSRLQAVAKDGDVLVKQRLANEIRHDPPVEGMHSGSVRIEDAYDADIDSVHAMIVHEQRFCRSFSLIIAGSWTNRIDVPAVIFPLRMDLWVAVNLAGRCLQHAGTAPLTNPQGIDCSHHRRFDRLDRIELVVSRSGRAGEIVDLVNLQPDRDRHIMPNQLEIGAAQQVSYIAFLAGKEVVEADDIMPCFDHPLT